MTTHGHPRFEELAGLRAYGELDAGEERVLLAHLEICDACRRFAAELECGLAAPEAAAGHELPGDWHARLDERVRARHARRTGPALYVATGLAAGLAVALLTGWRLRGSDTAVLDPAEPARVASNAAASTPPRFEAPPPPAASPGQAAWLGVLGGR
jgi:anti-sigma factor RsiW